MDWTDLGRLSALMQQLTSAGLTVAEIGRSGEGRPIYGVTAGDRQADRVVAIAAGYHATELIGPLTAITLLQSLPHKSWPSIRFHVVPVADPDCLYQNVGALASGSDLRSLLQINSDRDLEGSFTADTYPECVAIREWFEQLDRVDAYFSLHSAHCISPGVFFYVGDTSNPSWVKAAARQVLSKTPDWIPLLTTDPTTLSKKSLYPGFFEVSPSSKPDAEADGPTNSLAFMVRRFQPQYVGASELPLAISPGLSGAALTQIDRCNRDVRQTGHPPYPLREMSLETQLQIMLCWIGAVADQVTAL